MKILKWVLILLFVPMLAILAFPFFMFATWLNYDYTEAFLTNIGELLKLRMIADFRRSEK